MSAELTTLPRFGMEIHSTEIFFMSEEYLEVIQQTLKENKAISEIKFHIQASHFNIKNLADTSEVYLNYTFTCVLDLEAIRPLYRDEKALADYVFNFAYDEYKSYIVFH